MTTAIEERPAAGSRKRVRILGGGGAVVVAIVVALVIVYVAWWSKPTEFGGWGNKETSVQRVGHLVGRDVDMGGSLNNETIHLHGAIPVVVTNTADAQFTFVLCRPNANGPILGVTGSLEKYCASVTPLKGQAYNVGVDEKHEQLLVQVTPRKAGVVHIDGMRIRYTRDGRHLWQTGSEQVGEEVEIHVKP